MHSRGWIRIPITWRLIGGEEPGDDKILVEPELVIGNSTILRKNNL